MLSRQWACSGLLPLLLLNLFAANSQELTHSNRDQERTRLRRQFETRNGPQIDLNITVPYIFSARLYPYGLAKGDQLTHMDPQPVDLHVPLQFFGSQYQTIFIHKDGVIGASASSFLPPPSQNQMPLIAVYWMQSRGGRVFYRETTEPSIINLVQSEVNIQYRYGTSFKPKSVLIVTWEGTTDATDINDKDGNVFQIALVLAESGCFAHFVYSHLHTNNNAAAGFSGANGNGGHFSLPGSGTPNAIQLMEKSNIGIPGEWLFRIDESQIYLCGAGFQGIECVEACGPTQWYLDCSRNCHCASGVACDVETGACPDAKCSPGWTGAPICSEDVDECENDVNLCPAEQPDCVNTPGAYLCLCFEYDNITNSCKGSITGPAQKIPVPVMSLAPQIAPIVEKPQKRPSPVRMEGTTATNFHTSARHFTTTTTTHAPILVQTLQPLTIKPILSERRPQICPKCDPHAVCTNSICECNPGWQGNGIFCQDIDECENTQICGENSECQNTPGSFQCICATGFVATPTGCIDLNECAEGLVTCRGGNTSVCVNKLGGFDCACAPGYSGHPDTREGCTDINECDDPQLYCGNKSKCMNVPGSFRCDCFEGYEQARNSSQICVDVNECLMSPCDRNAICTNLDGTFECNCVEGFVGNGVTCRETILFSAGRNASSLPRVENANIPFRLETPLQLFNHAYETAYISANGVVSFDRAFTDIIAQPREVRSVAIFPFHLTNNLENGGTVSARQITESDASNYGLLTKASLIVQNKFNLKKFQATSVFIVTYDHVVPVNSNQPNTFQFVVAQSTNSTFVVFLYENMEDLNSHFVGITHPNGYIELPTNELTKRSNVGQPGKWIFQISHDGQIGHCPVGKLNPPFCEQDCEPNTWGFECANVCRCHNNMPCDFISGFCSNGRCAEGYGGTDCSQDLNECAASHLNRCDPNATCMNVPGSYKCTCRDQFHGDGFTCKSLDRCYKRFGKQCAKNAYCDETNTDYPECVCHEGFHGDGRRFCESDTLITSTESTTTTSARPRIMISNAGRSKEASDERPFLMNNWNSVEHAATPSTKQNIKPTPRPNETRPTLKTKPHKASENSIVEDELQEEGKADSVQEDASERMLLYLILPGIFMGIWFVLIIAIIIICCRRQRRSRIHKYSPQVVGFAPRDYTSTRNSYFSQTTFT